jgi:hypothetical protein
MGSPVKSVGEQIGLPIFATNFGDLTPHFPLGGGIASGRTLAGVF